MVVCCDSDVGVVRKVVFHLVRQWTTYSYLLHSSSSAKRTTGCNPERGRENKAPEKKGANYRMCVNCFLLLLLLACHVTVTCSKREMLEMDMTADSKDVCRTEMFCKGWYNPLDVPLSLQGPRGPPGKAGPSGPRGPKGMPGPAPPSVAFFVGLDRQKRPDRQSHHPDLIFDEVITNIGNAYDKETGRFTAPVNGAYQFTVVVVAHVGKMAAVDLMKQGHRVVTIWAESIPHWGAATNSVILTLARGEQVWLKLRSEVPYIYNNMFSTFSGFAVFASTDDN